MSTVRRRLGIAVLVATGALVASQLSAVVTAGASSAAPDGAKGANTASVSTSNVPYLVRTGKAKAAHPMAGSDKLRIAIGLKLRNQAELDQLKASLQDPKSSNYRRYLSASEFNARFGPTASSEAAVIKYATAHGLSVTKRYSNRLLVDLEGTVSQVQATFGVHLNEYTIGKKQYFANADEPKLGSIANLVTSVSGLDNVGQMKSASGATDTSKMPRYAAGPTQRLAATVKANGSLAKFKAAAKAGANPAITRGYYDPADLASSQAYDVNALQNVAPCCNPNHLASGSPAASSIAIVTAGSHNLGQDLIGFANAYGLAVSANEYYIDGTPSSPDYEGTMDIEWATAMANSYGSYLDTAHTYLYSGVNAQFTTFHDMYNSVLTNNTAKIVSSSWGCAEFYCISDAQMNTDHTIYDSMVAQGFTMVNSSGDRGAYADCSHVSVSNPAADPDWLAIGATNLELTTGPVYQSETAWGDVGNCSGNGGGTGGGCSAKYAAPSWQSIISGFCGSSARALPDFSLNGDWFNSPQNVFFQNAWSGNGGTSISAPMSAGLFARVNSYLIQIGNACGSGVACGPVGQGGSKIYSIANSGFSGGRKAFYDITSGCTTNEIGGGYCGIVGYDRATGWGSVNALDLAWGLIWYSVPEASAPTVTMSGPSTSGWVNSGSVSWSVTDNGSPATGVAGYTAKWDSDPGNPLSATTPGSGNSYYSGPAVHGTSGSAALLVGCHTLYVRAWDNMGLSSVNSYGPVCYDNTTPTVTAPKSSFLANKVVLNTGEATVRVQWKGADTLSGINHYTIWQQVDSGSYVQLTQPDATANYIDVALLPGHSYTYAVSVYDNANNWSGYSYSTPFTLNSFQEDSTKFAFSSGWQNATAGSYLGSHAKYTSGAGNTATFTFTGQKFMWVAPKGPTQGSARITIDGGAPKVVKMHTASAQPRRQVYRATAGAGPHTIVITNLATAGSPRIDVDAFYIMK